MPTLIIVPENAVKRVRPCVRESEVPCMPAMDPESGKVIFQLGRVEHPQESTLRGFQRQGVPHKALQLPQSQLAVHYQ
jgi:hypothetical protein